MKNKNVFQVAMQCTLRKPGLTVIILALTQKHCLHGKTTGQEPPVNDNNNNPSFQQERPWTKKKEKTANLKLKFRNKKVILPNLRRSKLPPL